MTFLGVRSGIAGTLLAIAAGQLTLYYVDGVGGLDTNDGLSAGTAWQTTAKVSGFAFSTNSAIVVQFKGGQTYADWTITQNRNAGNYFKVTSYGAGKATFAGGPSTGSFYFTDQGGIWFDNVIAAQLGWDTAAASGASSFIRITNCTLSQGTYFGGDSGTAGYSNVVISGNTFTAGGVSTYGSSPAMAAGTRVQFAFQILNNTIDGAGAQLGIQIGGANGVTISGNTLTNVKDYHGIWCYGTDNFTITGNTVSLTVNPAAHTADGNGIAADEDTTNGVIERNLTYNNMGAGFILSAFAQAGNANNGRIDTVKVRNNISINDCSGTVMVASFQLSSNTGLATVNAAVNNNTIYQSRPGKWCFATTQTPITARVSNNVFYTWGGASGAITTNGAVNPSNCLFTGNCYYGKSNAVLWNNVTYSGPDTWRTAIATQEDLSGAPAYIMADPRLLGPGTTVAADYNVQAGSPVLGTGLNLTALFGIAMPTTDYFGNAISAPYNVGCAGASSAVPSWATTGADIDIDFMTNRFYGGYQASMLSCSRALSGYAKNSAGSLLLFAADTPRLTDLGLLIEDARTNLCFASQTQNNATYWTPAAGATVATTVATTDPTGVTGALIYNEGTGTVVHNLANTAAGNANFTLGSIYCLSFFFKQGTGSLVQITPAIAIASGGPYANFDLAAGTVASTGGTGLVGSGIEAYGNGWYRCWMAFTCSTTATTGANGFLTLAAGTGATAIRAPSYTGTSRTIYVWGAQTEVLPAGAGSMGPSSYVQTTTAQVTRPADNISAAGSLFTKLSAANIPGVLTKFTRSGPSLFQGAFAAGDGTVNNRNVLEMNTTNVGTSITVLGGTPNASANTANTVATAFTAIALAARMKNNDQAVSLNNGAAGTVAATTYGSASVVTLGATSNALTSMMNGYLKRLTTFAADQDNATLATLSTP